MWDGAKRTSTAYCAAVLDFIYKFNFSLRRIGLMVVHFPWTGHFNTWLTVVQQLSEERHFYAPEDKPLYRLALSASVHSARLPFLSQSYQYVHLPL